MRLKKSEDLHISNVVQLVLVFFNEINTEFDQSKFSKTKIRLL
jgi:hypothetical protein